MRSFGHLGFRLLPMANDPLQKRRHYRLGFARSRRRIDDRIIAAQYRRYRRHLNRAQTRESRKKRMPRTRKTPPHRRIISMRTTRLAQLILRFF